MIAFIFLVIMIFLIFFLFLIGCFSCILNVYLCSALTVFNKILINFKKKKKKKTEILLYSINM